MFRKNETDTPTLYFQRVLHTAPVQRRRKNWDNTFRQTPFKATRSTDLIYSRFSNGCNGIVTLAVEWPRDLIASARRSSSHEAVPGKKGPSPEVVNRMYDAWWKSMILQATLWVQPYIKEGDF